MYVYELVCVYVLTLVVIHFFKQRDYKVGGMVFELLTQGIIDSREIMMDRRESDDWCQDVYGAVNNILESSYTYTSHLMKALLHLMVNNDITVDPENLSAG